MEPTAGVYSFEPLADHATRILLLAPGHGDDELRGRLQCISLACCPPFEALSYEWGDGEKTHSITLGAGVSTRITRCLHRALRDLRHEVGGSRALWADGICINQDDLEERQKQVAMMGHIYRQAARVVTYIGPETDGSSSALSFARYLIAYSHFQRRNRVRGSQSQEVANFGLPTRDDIRWEALQSLFLRGWVCRRDPPPFGRVIPTKKQQAGRCWCAQEFLVNKSLIMMCGRLEIPDWEMIPDVVRLVFNRALPAFILPDHSKDPYSIRECLTAIARLRRFIQTERALSLFALLRMLHPLRATDPRDKVYSVVGLALDNHEIGIPIDYGCTPEQLYISVAKRLVATDVGLEILYSNIPKKAFDLPSWVPDWSTWMFGTHGTHLRAGYGASGNRGADLRLRGNTLDISGSLVDRLARLSDNIGKYYVMVTELHSISRRRPWLEEQLEAVQQLHPYPDGSEPRDVLWRSLIGNIDFNQKPASNGYRHLFDAHLRLAEDSSEMAKDEAREFCDATRRRSRYRRLASTGLGYFGAVPQGAEVGDWVCLLHGGSHLYVVRQNAGEFTYIGPAYIHGLMHGEALRLPGYKERTISIT